MSDQSFNLVDPVIKTFIPVEIEIDITNGHDSGLVGIHQSRFNIPAQTVFLPFATGYVGANPLVGSGASVAIGTDDVTTDPDNMLDTTAITGLDAENDCITPAIGTAIVNNTDSAVPIYYNVSAAALTAGVLKYTALSFSL